MPPTMKQWWVVPGTDGGRSELRVVEIASPGPNQVLVKVEAAAINRGELIARPLLVSTNPKARPAPSGIEFAGTVAEIGSAVTDYEMGRPVMGRGSGCHAEFTIADADGLMAIPNGLSFPEAAAIPNVFVTAHDALVSNAAMETGESVLVTAGPSGVGTAAIQIARHLGAGRIVATTRSRSKGEALRSLGATDVIDSTDRDWPDRVGEQVGAIDVAIDQVGGDLFGPVLETLAVAGRYVTVGRNGGRRTEIDLDLVARKRLKLIGVTFRTRSPAEAVACTTRFADQLLSAFDLDDDGSPGGGTAGGLQPVLDRTFPLAELPSAHEYMLTDRQFGKIVLVT